FHPERSFRAAREIAFPTGGRWICGLVPDRDDGKHRLQPSGRWSFRTCPGLPSWLEAPRKCCARCCSWPRTAPIPISSDRFPLKRKSSDGGDRLLHDWSERTASTLRHDSREPPHCCVPVCWWTRIVAILQNTGCLPRLPGHFHRHS